MFVPFFIVRNALRHKLRTTLTMIGIVVAIVAFGLLRTIVDAWYAGAEATSSARLITRNAISLVFPLPLSYAQKLRQVQGVSSVTWANWFGGIYITEGNFFPQLAIETSTYLDMYPEYRIAADQRKAFLIDRQGAIAGRKIAEKFGWKLGDQIPIRGTIFPGTWTFTLRAIYDGADSKVDETQFFFHWGFLNESVKARFPRRGDQIGLYIVEIRDPTQAAEISQRIDATFKNSMAETLTETEKAFQLSFVAMTEAILAAIQAVSYVIVLIIMAVMANTMAMTARERYSEYATMKAIGFSNGFVAFLIFAESMGIAAAGGLVGIALTYPIADAFGAAMGTLFPVFFISRQTITLQLAAALLVGFVAALIPAWRVARVRIVDGLRSIA
ncbi:MAG: ABC transporter permease [Burkholderiales bacterium]|nr:ABC transporter permease [Burkholderiales bacterium]